MVPVLNNGYGIVATGGYGTNIKEWVQNLWLSRGTALVLRQGMVQVVKVGYEPVVGTELVA